MAFLDIKTILTLTALTLFAVAGAMSLVMGRQLSPAASAARGSLIAQAGGWTAIVAAEFVWDMPLSVLAIACGSAANCSCTPRWSIGWVHGQGACCCGCCVC
jgi:hypothetical protein